MAWENIYFYRFLVTFQAQREGLLPRYKGSLLRGALGRILRRISCVRRKDPHCVLCPLRGTCAYGVVFEGHSTGHICSQKYRDPPRPYLLFPLDEGQRLYLPGDTLTFQFVLVGEAIKYFPHLAICFREMANQGLGSEHLPFQTIAIEELRPDGFSRNIWDSQRQHLYPPSEEAKFTLASVQSSPLGEVLHLKFLTPCRIKSLGKLLNRELPFEILIERLQERLSLLSSLHCRGEVASENRFSLDKARQVKIVENKLRWLDLPRRSSRQGRMKLGGLVGEVSYIGPWQEYFSLICLGEYLHVGKSVTFGLGRYLIRGKNS